VAIIVSRPGRGRGHERPPFRPGLHGRGGRDPRAISWSACAWRRPGSIWSPPTTPSTSSPGTAVSARPRPCAGSSRGASASPPTPTGDASASSRRKDPGVTERLQVVIPLFPPSPPSTRRALRGAPADPPDRCHLHRPSPGRGPKRERHAGHHVDAPSRSTPTGHHRLPRWRRHPAPGERRAGPRVGAAAHATPASPPQCAPGRWCWGPPDCSGV
jgi:hypothetical protein